MIVAVLGAGAGALASLVDLAQRGFSVRLWARSRGILETIEGADGVEHSGVLGDGTTHVSRYSNDLCEIVDGADVAVICVPTYAHRELAQRLAELKAPDLPIVLSPGHTGGALAFSTSFRDLDMPPPPTAELSTLPYVARKRASNAVHVSGVASRIRLAALPQGEPALSAALSLYPTALEMRDVLATGLCNVNMVLHPPGAILSAAWIEKTQGDFTFYVDGLPKSVGKVMEALDIERCEVAKGSGHDLPSLFYEMQTIGTIDQRADPKLGLAAAVRGGVANQSLKAPDSLSHRYYLEDFWYGLKPFIALADLAGEEVPVARSLMTLASTATPFSGEEGRSSRMMGIAGLTKDQLLQRVRG